MVQTKVFGAIALVGICGVASAGTMTFNGVDPLAGTVTIGGTHYNGGVYAGLLDFNESSLGSIQTVCVDLDHAISGGQTWPDTIFDSASYADAGIQLAGNIVAADMSKVTTADQALGLQIAVWKVRYDGAADATPDFTTGNFTATGFSADALAAANLYWQDRNTVGHATYIRNEDGQGQDQMRAGAVPEPASMSILAVGIVGLMRRRAKKNA